MGKAILLGVSLIIGVGGGCPAAAAIDWAGNGFPIHGTTVLATTDLNVFAQVFKAGVTEPAGAGADISAVLRYETDLLTIPVEVAMTFNRDIGSNDEYMGAVPQAALAGASMVDVTVFFTDETDSTTVEIIGDHEGNPPPLRYLISDGLPNDVTVTFTLCLSGAASSGDVCVSGSTSELTDWGNGVVMATADDELYEVDVVFLAGSNPVFQYKYRKDDCVTWEDDPNRTMTLPTDGSITFTVGPDSWNRLPLGCGLGDTLAEWKVVCFQVCMDGVEHSGDVCVTGSHSLLTNWGSGIVTYLTATDLYEFCLRFPAGIPVPGEVEYKFRKDDCVNWETVPNRVVVVDNESLPAVKLTHTWDDGPGQCAEAVGVAETTWEETSWGRLKSIYR